MRQRGRRPVPDRVFFFFQAEDGIRDKLVTGVQTCALPIYRRFGLRGAMLYLEVVGIFDLAGQMRRRAAAAWPLAARGQGRPGVPGGRGLIGQPPPGFEGPLARFPVGQMKSANSRTPTAASE